MRKNNWLEKIARTPFAVFPILSSYLVAFFKHFILNRFYPTHLASQKNRLVDGKNVIGENENIFFYFYNFFPHLNCTKEYPLLFSPPLGIPPSTSTIS